MPAISVRQLSSPLRMLLVWSIRGYQTFISPAFPRRCKYYPSCSQYAVDALTQYGVLRGVVLAGWRLLRCNPFSYGGYDPAERQRLFRPRQRPETQTACPGGCGDAVARPSRRRAEAGGARAGHVA